MQFQIAGHGVASFVLIAFVLYKIIIWCIYWKNLTKHEVNKVIFYYKLLSDIMVLFCVSFLFVFKNMEHLGYVVIFIIFSYLIRFFGFIHIRLYQKNR